MPNVPIYFLPGTNIHVLAPRKDLDFFDSQSIDLSQNITPLQAWNIVVSQPSPLLKTAFQVRDTISAWFGVQRIGGFSGTVPINPKVGEKIDFFLIEEISSNNLTLTQRDKHLDVMTCISISQNELSITSSVKTHNVFGRLYMLPVAPAHRLIVRNNLKQIKSELLKSTKGIG